MTEGPQEWLLFICCVCGLLSMANPYTVPVHPVGPDGLPTMDPAATRTEAICRACILKVNEARKATGQPQWHVAPGTYPQDT